MRAQSRLVNNRQRRPSAALLQERNQDGTHVRPMLTSKSERRGQHSRRLRSALPESSVKSHRCTVPVCLCIATYEGRAIGRGSARRQVLSNKQSACQGRVFAPRRYMPIANTYGPTPLAARRRRRSGVVVGRGRKSELWRCARRAPAVLPIRTYRPLRAAAASITKHKLNNASGRGRSAPDVIHELRGPCWCGQDPDKKTATRTR